MLLRWQKGRKLVYLGEMKERFGEGAARKQCVNDGVYKMSRTSFM